MDTKKHYAPGSHPDLPPPPGTIGIVGWLYRICSRPLVIRY